MNRAPKFSPAIVTLNSPLQDKRKLTHVGEGHRGEGQAQNGGRGPGERWRRPAPPGQASSLPLQGAGLGRARRLRREPALAAPSSFGQRCVKPEPRAPRGPRGGDPGGIRQLSSRRRWAEEATGSGVGGGGDEGTDLEPGAN